MAAMISSLLNFGDFGNLFRTHLRHTTESELPSVRDTLQTPRATNNWERNEGPQTVGLQAVLGLPTQFWPMANCWSRRRRSRLKPAPILGEYKTKVNKKAFTSPKLFAVLGRSWLCQNTVTFLRAG